ncbi:MAG: hypothetical protein FJ102_06385 [Deltaproteobacteria bacterium]|nr:hypothetical protein [Deltaproteobacteria bacterium]
MPPPFQIPFGPDLRVFVDTSALMEPGADRSFETLAPELKRHGLKAIVPQRVIDELKKMTGSRGALAAKGLRILERLRQEGLLDIKGETDDGYVDNLFQAVFVRFRLKYSLLLITQDGALAQDVLSLNDANAVQRIRGIFAARVAGGGLQGWTSGEADRARPVRAPGQSGTAPVPAAIPSHHLVTQSAALEIVKTVPGLGDQVSDAAGRVHRLAKLLGTGGEGSAFLTDTGMVCKIYRADRLFRTRLEKLELMARNPVGHRAICWPTSVVRRSEGRVGYLMSAARGRELQKSVFVKPLLVQHFPSWRKVNLVQLAISVLEPIAQLNSRGILLGDINPRNILVASDSEIYLVDTDSYQFMGHPCTVGMPPFLAPDLYGKQLDAMLRTPEHEAFAVSTLVFMLMLPGKPPYSHQGGEDPAKNVKAGKFPYAVGDRKGKAVPEGPWRFQWSHLPRYMKEELDGVFTDGKPLGAAAWLDILVRYRNDLARGNVSNELFPTALKELNQAQTLKAGGRWVPCTACGKEFGLFEPHPQPLCNACKAKRVAEKAARELAAAPQPARARSALPSAPTRATPPRAAAPRAAPQRPAPPPPPAPPAPVDPLTAVIKWIASLFG